MIIGVHSLIFTYSPYIIWLYMIFQNFHEDNYYRKGQFQENSKNHIWAELAKIQEIALVIIFTIFSKNGKFRFITKILKFQGIWSSNNR